MWSKFGGGGGLRHGQAQEASQAPKFTPEGCRLYRLDHLTSITFRDWMIHNWIIRTLIWFWIIRDLLWLNQMNSLMIQSITWEAGGLITLINYSHFQCANILYVFITSCWIILMWYMSHVMEKPVCVNMPHGWVGWRMRNVLLSPRTRNRVFPRPGP